MHACPYCQRTLTANARRATECPHCSQSFGPDAIWYWKLEQYSYAVNLETYAGAGDFQPDFFSGNMGNRSSTIHFEDRFRAFFQHDDTPAAAFLEVIYWKMYSNAMIRNRQADAIRSHLVDGNTVTRLKQAINDFIDEPTASNGDAIRVACGYSQPVIAAAFTFPAFVDPERFSMVDRRIAKWVNQFGNGHAYGGAALRPFARGYSTLRMNDFGAYLAWLHWCRRCAAVLAERQPEVGWRPRDVEMVCFTAYQQDLPRLVA